MCYCQDCGIEVDFLADDICFDCKEIENEPKENNYSSTESYNKNILANSLW